MSNQFLPRNLNSNDHLVSLSLMCVVMRKGQRDMAAGNAITESLQRINMLTNFSLHSLRMIEPPKCDFQWNLHGVHTPEPETVVDQVCPLAPLYNTTQQSSFHTQ